MCGVTLLQGQQEVTGSTGGQHIASPKEVHHLDDGKMGFVRSSINHKDGS